MNRDKLLQMLRITGKYYIQHMSQKDIAEEEKISVPTVSRMISKAMDSGYVKISIDYSFLSEEELAEEIRKRWGLRKVLIVPAVLPDPQAVLLDTCRAAADYLRTAVTDDAVIGTAWGNTMKCLASCIEPMDASGVRIVQLNGRCADIAAAQGADDMVMALLRAAGGTGFVIPAPAVVDDARTAQMLREDSGIKSVLSLAEQCSAAVFSTGAMSRDSIMYKSGFLDGGMYEALLERGAVGDIASGYFDINGEIVDRELAARRISLPLEKFRDIPLKICVASGNGKAQALHGALQGGFIDTLITDEELGRALLAIR